jgi:hypothetical protein
MTIPVLKIKVLPKAVVKGKMDVRFPANVAVDDFLTVLKANGTYTFGADYTLLDPTPFANPAATLVAVYDQTSASWKVNANTGVAVVNQTVGAAKTLTLPLSSVKTCPVLISDFKGDAGTNNITINLTGSDKFPGNLTSWTIAADTGSIFLRPISGVGYAL